MNGEFEISHDPTNPNVPVIELTPAGGAPVRLALIGDSAFVTANDSTSGPNIVQGQNGQTAAAALRAAFGLLAIMLVFVLGCANPDGMGGMGEAAAKASGGDAGGRAGSIESDIVGGYMPGDIEAWRVTAQRNTTASKAGDVYSAVTVNAASGASALREAVASDPVLGLIRDEIAALKTAERTPETTARLDALRAELAARVKELETAAAKASPSITIGDVHQEVTASPTIGKDPPAVTTADAAAAAEIKGVIGAAKSPETKPAQ